MCGYKLEQFLLKESVIPLMTAGSPSSSTAFLTDSWIVYSVKGGREFRVAIMVVASPGMLRMISSGCLLVRLTVNPAMGLNPLESGFVQEMVSELTVSELGTTARPVGGPGGTGVGGR